MWEPKGDFPLQFLLTQGCSYFDPNQIKVQCLKQIIQRQKMHHYFFHLELCFELLFKKVIFIAGKQLGQRQAIEAS